MKGVYWFVSALPAAVLLAALGLILQITRRGEGPFRGTVRLGRTVPVVAGIPCRALGDLSSMPYIDAVLRSISRAAIYPRRGRGNGPVWYSISHVWSRCDWPGSCFVSPVTMTTPDHVHLCLSRQK